MAEKYYSISPYVYCASNPVNIVDPEGMEFTERSNEYIERVLAYSNEQISFLSKARMQLKAMTEINHYDENEMSLINQVMSSIDSSIRGFLQAKNEIDILSESNQLYDILPDRSLNDGNTIVSATVFNFDTGTIELRLGDESLGLLSH